MDRGRAGERREKLAARVDDAITLAAPGVAPIGLRSTGNAVFAVVSSYFLRRPAVSLPLLALDGLAVGLEIIGSGAHDADLVAMARWLCAALPRAQL